MYGTIRLILCAILIIVLLILIKKLQACKIARIAVIFTIILLAALLCIFPFENLLITFSSPKSAYTYYYGATDNKTVISGQDSDLVIGTRRDADLYLIVPKTEKGWKIGLGLNTKKVSQQVVGDISVSVYQYKDSKDCYVVILDTSGDTLTIVDSLGTNFIVRSKENNTLDKTYSSYYAFISISQENNIQITDSNGHQSNLIVDTNGKVQEKNR